MTIRTPSMACTVMVVWISLGGAVAACTSDDQIVSVIPPPSGGSAGASTSGAAGATTGASGSGGGGSPGAGGSANPSTGGAAGVPIDMTPDAALEGGEVDAATEAPPSMPCPNPTMCLKAALVHRYSFMGTGTVVTDSVGTSHGSVVNGQLSGNGDVVLAGGDAAPTSYVDLPNGIVSTLTNATFEVWLTWTDDTLGWQRLFDFGNSDKAEDVQGIASTTFYLTPRGSGPTVMLAGFKRSDQMPAMETHAQSTQGLATSMMSHVAVVVDQAQTLITLYRNGITDGSAPFTDSLSIF